MKKFMQLMKVIILFITSVLCFTIVNGIENENGSWETLTTNNTPGYDENGQDIDECALYAPCPEGYICRNLPGSYICEAEPGFEGEVPSQPNPGGGITPTHSIFAHCVGTSLLCSALCQDCLRLYTSYALGKATNIQGTCLCGKKNFKAL